MRLFSTLIFSILLVCSAQFSSAHGSDWHLEKDKNGVKVYTKKSESSNLKDSKGLVTIKTDSESVVKHLSVYNDYPNWMFKITEGKLIETISENERYVYTITDAPWPVSDRDLIVHSITTVNPDGSVLIDLTGKADLIPENKNLVRIPKFKGHWKITPNGDGTVEVEYAISSDPGGKIPDMLANSTSVDIPYHSLLGLKKALEQ